jgi:hypothetical protein
MQNLIRLVYVSRSTFISSSSARGIEPNVARILAKSRVNNRKLGLVGALYFGDGCFFQCLEGEQSAVDDLFAKISADKRHTDLKVLLRDGIAQTTFTDWSMKYVLSEKKVWDLLREEGLNAFDPYRLSDAATRKLLSFLLDSDDSETDAGMGDAKQSTPKRPLGTSPQKPPAASGGRWHIIGSAVLVLIALAAIGAVIATPH